MIKQYFSIDAKYYLNIFLECAANLKDWAGDGDKQYTGPIPSQSDGLHQMARGLAFVHNNHHVHRDICPANILISLHGDRLIISDFGLCKQVHESGSYSVSNVNGQEQWLAPERMTNRFDSEYRVTIISDTWAMGCVFYYFITRGSHPFHNTDWTIMQNNILEGNCNLNSESYLFESLTASS